VVISVLGRISVGNREFPLRQGMEIDEEDYLKLMIQRSASVIRPILRAVLTASPRLLASSFLKMLRR
jgi:hypothetical protein